MRPLLVAAITVIAAGASLQRLMGQAGQRPVIHGGYPSVSPDGSRLAFLSNRDGPTDLYVISTDGTGEAGLTRTPEEESPPDWTADGGEIRFAVFADAASRLYAIRPDGTGRRLLGSVPGRAATVSPDGKRVLYSVGSWTAVRLFVSDLDGSGARQLTDGSSVVWNTRWSPDGKRIAFTGRDADGVLHVYVMDSDGSNQRQLTHFPPGEGQAQVPDWSPDGRQLAVQTSGRAHVGHVWIVDAEAGAARKLGAHSEPYVDEVPRWFPNGKRIAFQSDRTGRMEVWVMDSDGSGQRLLTR